MQTALYAIIISLTLLVGEQYCQAEGYVNSEQAFRVAPSTHEEPVNADETDPRISAYVKYLNSLDNENVKSILLGREEFQKVFSTAPMAVMDDAFRVFWGYHKNVIVELDHEFYAKKYLQRVLGEISGLVSGGLKNPLPAFEKLNNEKSNVIRNKYASELQELYIYMNSGIDFTNGEGDWYLKEYLPFLIKMFPASGGNELREYLIFSNKEDTRIGEDAGLLISWEEYRERIIRWEKFKNDHLNLLETQTEVAGGLDGLVRGYIEGAPNTRAYNIETGVLDPGLKSSYKSFIKKNKSSSFYRLIKAVYGLLAKHNFKVEEELLSYLDANGFSASARELERMHEQDLLQVTRLQKNGK